MAEGEPSGDASTAESSILMRAVRALELLFSAHATIARLEARNDLARILSGLFLAGAALAMLAIAVVLGHVVAAIALEARLECGYPTSIGAIAGADLVIAAVFFLGARARLQAPVLVETRATMKKAVSTLRG